MNIVIDRRNSSSVAIVRGPDGCIATPQDALDLMATLGYEHQCRRFALDKNCLTEDFFDLKTGVAGEILQKYSTYDIHMAIVGDYSGYTSKALQDFIYESNKAGRIMFLPTTEEALDRLHGNSGQ